MSKSILQEKSYRFALRIVKLSKFLSSEMREFSLSKKVLDSGTAIGVLIEEAKQGEDRSDFSKTLSIANKEAFKTNYWLRLLHDSDFLNDIQFGSLLKDCEELQKMLISSIKTTKIAAD
ncbi:MAG: four helix bundle protein [Pyrinomonadaceae bacterium]